MIVLYLKNFSNKYFLYLLLTFWISACKEVKENRQNNVIKKVKSLQIELDSLTTRPIFAKEIQIWDNYFVLFNQKKQKIQFYDLKKGSFIKAISLKKEGTDGVGEVKDFFIASIDSIFLLAPHQYQIYLVDTLGKVFSKFKLLKAKQFNESSAMPDPMPFYHPMIQLNGKLHISSIPDDNPYRDSFYQRENLATIVDLEKKEINYAYSFPDNYRKNIYPSNMNFYSRVYIPHLKKFAYSFLQDEHIRLVSTDYKKETKYKATPEQFTLFRGLKKRITDAFEDSKIGNTLPSFVSLMHDSFRKRTYRILQIPNIKNNRAIKNDFKLILLEFDKDFNKIKEIVFDEKSVYNPLNIFFTSEGMWMQRITDNEDELVYDLVEFVSE